MMMQQGNKTSKVTKREKRDWLKIHKKNIKKYGVK